METTEYFMSSTKVKYFMLTSHRGISITNFYFMKGDDSKKREQLLYLHS